MLAIINKQLNYLESLSKLLRLHFQIKLVGFWFESQVYCFQMQAEWPFSDVTTMECFRIQIFARG